MHGRYFNNEAVKYLIALIEYLTAILESMDPIICQNSVYVVANNIKPIFQL